jgi:hypothetical protein
LDGLTYLRIIGSQGNTCIAAGDVHGISRHQIPELRRTLGHGFNAAVVVRDPLPRLDSQLALFRRFQDYEVWDLDYVDAVISRSGIVLQADDYRTRFFVHAANMLNEILGEVELGTVYRSEDLTSRVDVVGAFVEDITRGRVSPDSAWLQSVIQIGKINVHASPRQHRPLSDWQMYVIGKVVDRRSWEIYESLGYSHPEFAAR